MSHPDPPVCKPRSSSSGQFRFSSAMVHRSTLSMFRGACCVLCFFFTYLFVPETKGLSLEQVDILYRNSSILGSNAYRQKILDEDIHDVDTAACTSPSLFFPGKTDSERFYRRGGGYGQVRQGRYHAHGGDPQARSLGLQRVGDSRASTCSAAVYSGTNLFQAIMYPSRSASPARLALLSSRLLGKFGDRGSKIETSPQNILLLCSPARMLWSGFLSLVTLASASYAPITAPCPSNSSLLRVSVRKKIKLSIRTFPPFSRAVIILRGCV